MKVCIARWETCSIIPTCMFRTLFQSLLIFCSLHAGIKHFRYSERRGNNIYIKNSSMRKMPGCECPGLEPGFQFAKFGRKGSQFHKWQLLSCSGAGSLVMNKFRDIRWGPLSFFDQVFPISVDSCADTYSEICLNKPNHFAPLISTEQLSKNLSLYSGIKVKEE